MRGVVVMAGSVVEHGGAVHHKGLASLRLSRANVLNSVETVSDDRQRVGRALAAAIKFLNLDDAEALTLLAVNGKPMDKGQLSRWLSGKERLHVDRILRTRLHGPFVIALANIQGGQLVVETTVTYRGGE